MKTKHLSALLVTLLLSGCDQKTAVIRTELRLIEKTAKDTTQREAVRKSAEIFADILSEKQEMPRTDWSFAHMGMMGSRNPTTITTYVAFLKALEKKLPDQLPSADTYQAMEDKAGRAKFIEYNVAKTVLMMSNSIRNITLYNDPSADAEVEGVLKRMTEKYGTLGAGQKILDLLNTVHDHGLNERSRGIKPWESPK
jgi:hypothetical protein